jgi:hypothetical protein
MVRKRSKLSKPSTPICTRCGRLMELRLGQLELTATGIKAGEWYCPRCDAPPAPPCSPREWQDAADGYAQDREEEGR